MAWKNANIGHNSDFISIHTTIILHSYSFYIIQTVFIQHSHYFMSKILISINNSYFISIHTTFILHSYDFYTIQTVFIQHSYDFHIILWAQLSAAIILKLLEFIQHSYRTHTALILQSYRIDTEFIQHSHYFMSTILISFHNSKSAKNDNFQKSSHPVLKTHKNYPQTKNYVIWSIFGDLYRLNDFSKSGFIRDLP